MRDVGEKVTKARMKSNERYPVRKDFWYLRYSEMKCNPDTTFAAFFTNGVRRCVSKSGAYKNLMANKHTRTVMQ